MNTTTVEEQLAAIRRQIDELETRASTGTADAKARVESHIEALRHEEAAAVAASHKASAEVDGKLAQLKTRLEVAENSLAADGYEARSAFTAAVEEELQSWDAFFERLQTTAATKSGQAREQAEAAIRDLRARRLAIAERLEELRSASDTAWQEQRQRVLAAREELERKADELSSKLGGR